MKAHKEAIGIQKSKNPHPLRAKAYHHIATHFSTQPLENVFNPTLITGIDIQN